MSDDLPPLTESQRLDILIESHTKAVDDYDKKSIDRIKADSKELYESLIKFNTTQQKESLLFVCLFKLMKTSELHFQHVLKTRPAHNGRSDDLSDDLNTLLRRIFTIESKWYTTSSTSADYDDSMTMTDEFIRLSKSSIKCPIPSILFLEFFLYVCNQIVLLVEPLKTKFNQESKEEEEEEEEEEEDETYKHGILMFVGLIGKVARHADNTALLNDSVELNNIEYLTPEDKSRATHIRNKIVKIHEQNIRNPTGQLQITLSLSSAIGYLCEEIIKYYVPSAATGYTQSDDVQDTSPPIRLRVRNVYTQQFLNDSSILREMAKQKGWCPFIFKTDGCYNRNVVHRGELKHPDGYNKDKRYFYDIITHKVVMIDPRAWSTLFSFVRKVPNPSHRSHPYSRGGRNYHNISRRLKKQYYSIRRIHRQRKSIPSTRRRISKTRHHRTRARRRN